MAAIRSAVIVGAACALALAAGVYARGIVDEAVRAGRTTPPQPRDGGTLRLFSEAPTSLDPRDVESVYEALPINQIFDGLIRLDAALNVMPSLAQTWTISRDGLLYTFNLREGVRFHDGTPLTAGDVVFSFRRALAPRSGKRSVAADYMEAVEGAAAFASGRSLDLPGIRALDSRSVEIRLRRPSPSFLDVLTLDCLRVVPRRTVERFGDATFRRSPVGTGPFRFVSTTEDRMVLRANRDYFLKAPRLDDVEIVFPAVGESDRGESRFRHGEVDAFEAGPTALAELAGDRDVAIDRFQELSVSFLGFATRHPNFEDRRVRLAVAHAIERKAIVEIAPATRRLAHGILPPGLPGYSPAVKTIPYDPAKARDLLAESGHAAGHGLKPFKIYVSSGSFTEQRTLDRLRSDLRAVGLPCDVERIEWGDLSARLADQAASAFIIGWVADLTDPDGFLRALFAPEATANYFGFRDAEAMRLLDAAAATGDPSERARSFAAVEKRILDEAPFVPLFHSVGVLARRKAVHGLEPGPLGLAAVDLENVWIEETR